MSDDLANKKAAFHALIPVLCELGKQHDVHPFDMIEVLLMAAANIVALRHAYGSARRDLGALLELYDAEAGRYLVILEAVINGAGPSMRAAVEDEVAALVLAELEAILASRRS